MPRLQRRVRLRERDDFNQWSTKWQVLMHGGALLENGQGYATREEERRGWLEHRVELLGKCEAGQRPAAFYWWDLNITDRIVRYWHDQLTVLMDRGLIGAEEAARIDSHGMLDPEQSRHLCESFEDEAMIRAQRLDEGSLRGMASEFETAARWHSWRARPELAERYRLRAEVTRRVADGSR